MHFREMKNNPTWSEMQHGKVNKDNGIPVGNSQQILIIKGNIYSV